MTLKMGGREEGVWCGVGLDGQTWGQIPKGQLRRARVYASPGGTWRALRRFKQAGGQICFGNRTVASVERRAERQMTNNGDFN